MDNAKLTAHFIAAAKDAEAKGLVIPWAQIIALLPALLPLLANPAIVQFLLSLLGGLSPKTGEQP